MYIGYVHLLVFLRKRSYKRARMEPQKHILSVQAMKIARIPGNMKYLPFLEAE